MKYVKRAAGVVVLAAMAPFIVLGLVFALAVGGAWLGVQMSHALGDWIDE